MKNIFIFCASEKKARINFGKTIRNPVPENLVLGCFPAAQHEELLRWQISAGGFFAWGIKPGSRALTMLSKLEGGDCVLGFFDFHYRSVSRLVGKIENSEMAGRLWGNEAWSYIIFLSKPREIAVPATAVQPYLCSTYRGASRISSEKIQSIVRDFGSVDAFVNKHLEI